MKCPNCGKNISDGFICPHCGIDVYIFTKAVNVSIRLYNTALDAAKTRDLSHAISLLEQSLAFDKNNIDARNLLGLIQTEIGHIADAMKHWIISVSIAPENNLASSYIKYWQKHARELEKYNDAVRMYNQSLQYLQQGSEDLAIIQLKKCLDVNPHFLDAYNLMTLCCLKDNNQKRALHFIELALRKDCKNNLALLYLKELGGEKRLTFKKDKAWAKKEEATDITLKRTDEAPPMPRYKRSEKRTHPLLDKKDMIAFVCGIVATAAVWMFLVSPALHEEKDKTIEQLQAQVENYAGATNMSPEEVAELLKKATILENENKQLRSEETKQANIELLETAVSLLHDQQYETCAETLGQIDTLGFSEEDIQRYEQTKTEAFAKAADILFAKGETAMTNQQLTEAKTYFETVLQYVTTGEIMGNSYYYLAQIAEKNEDLETAKTYYQKVIKEFPNTAYVDPSQAALQELEKNPTT